MKKDSKYATDSYWNQADSKYTTAAWAEENLNDSFELDKSMLAAIAGGSGYREHYDSDANFQK